MTLLVAGHLFQKDGKCLCGKRFDDISGALNEDIGKLGWAHSGQLTSGEYDQIAKERDRIWSHVVGCATGSGPVQAAPEVPPMYDDAHFG